MVLLHFVDGLVQVFFKQRHDGLHLVLRALPVFRGERVDRQVLDAEIFAVGGDTAERFRACRMAHLARQTALFCPAAVAVHDDGDMPGQSIVFHIKLAFHDKSRRPAAFYLPKSRGFWAIWLRRLHRKVLAA